MIKTKLLIFPIGLIWCFYCCSDSKTNDGFQISTFEDSVIVQGAEWEHILRRVDPFSEVNYDIDTVTGYLYINDFSTAIYAINIRSGDISYSFSLDSIPLGKGKKYKMIVASENVIFSNARILLVLTRKLKKRTELVQDAFEEFPDLDIAEYVKWDYSLKHDSIYFELAYKLYSYDKEDSILIVKGLDDL